MIDIKKTCSISTEKMIRIAINDHKNKFDGALPKLIIIPPCVYVDLANSSKEAKALFVLNSSGFNSLHGVPIFVDNLATELTLINVKNETEYI